MRQIAEFRLRKGRICCKEEVIPLGLHPLHPARSQGKNMSARRFPMSDGEGRSFQLILNGDGKGGRRRCQNLERRRNPRSAFLLCRTWNNQNQRSWKQPNVQEWSTNIQPCHRRVRWVPSRRKNLTGWTQMGVCFYSPEDQKGNLWFYND